LILGFPVIFVFMLFQILLDVELLVMSILAAGKEQFIGAFTAQRSI